ncbi:MAG: plasmid mobilization system relaxase, partial [Ruminococcus sp.]|nr:plasmid mobilization system relaxase [Ruminococcus sp.]
REELGDKPINVKAWQREYNDLKTEYSGLREQYNPLKEDLAKLRQVQYQVSRVINEREPEQQIQHNRTIEGR